MALHDAQIAFYDKDLKTEITALAERRGQSMSNVCRQLLRQALGMEVQDKSALTALSEELQRLSSAVSALQEKVESGESSASKASQRRSKS
jgi:transposase-like protein